MEIIKVENLSFKYPLCNEPAVSDISFGIQKGDFVVLCGATGCGKSTLLRMLKRELTPLGEKTGSIFFNGIPAENLDDKTSASVIGFVMQKPEQQIVTDKVWHELAFGPENLNLPQNTMKRRIAEIVGYFGIGDLYYRNTSELSGGQKQLLCLAAVLAMNPEILILDEPTSQLDPVAASDFISSLKKLNRDFGITVLMTEHRLEEAVPVCDRLMVMEKGRITANGSPEAVISEMKADSAFMCGMPAAARLYSLLDIEGTPPITVREGRRFIEKNYGNDIRAIPEKEIEIKNTEVPALEFREVYFRYSGKSPDVLSGLSITVYKGEILCILGSNGSGKTTMLSAAADIIRPYSGKIKIFGEKIKNYKNGSLYRNCLSLLPQDVQTVFLRNTVREELKDSGVSSDELPFDLSKFFDMHPYDLSGGEQQLVGLAKILGTKPKILLLDEPTKGIDPAAKLNLIGILRELRESGMTVVIVTHDIEFSSECADRCAMFFGGNIVSVDTPNRFFAENTFYTTAISRMTRGYYDNAVTVGEAVELCGKNSRKSVSNNDSN